MNGIRRSALLGLAILALNFATGCVYCTHPLSDAKTSEPDLRLVGTWEYWDPEKEPKVVTTVEIVQKKDSPNVLVATSESDGEKETTEFFTTKIGDDYYLSIVTEDDNKKPQYVIAKYEFAGDTFKYRGLGHQFLADAIKAKKIAGRLEEKKGKDIASFTNVVISASTEELRKFIEEHGDKCLDNDTTFPLRKVKKVK